MEEMAALQKDGKPRDPTHHVSGHRRDKRRTEDKNQDGHRAPEGEIQPFPADEIRFVVGIHDKRADPRPERLDVAAAQRKNVARRLAGQPDVGRLVTGHDVEVGLPDELTAEVKVNGEESRDHHKIQQPWNNAAQRRKKTID